uniref:Uncharacterized protein n=1 Tax=viral metagenome TaxID=1070528 RepID=A0A6C0ADP1_9ZZZZ
MEEYLKKYNISQEDIPDFADSIFNWKLLDFKEKKRFIKNFLLRYINDQDFRNKMKDYNYMIVFLDKKYLGPFKNSEDFQYLRTKGDHPRSFDIGISDLFQ